MALQDAVFILGAGASRPFQFPAGCELRDIIINETYPAVTEKFPAVEIKKFKDDLRASMALSIDTFLQRCEDTGRSLSAEIGVASIAAALLPREQLSLEAGHDWYAQLFGDVLLDRFVPEDRRLQILTFNYDRSLEYFFLKGFMGADNLYASEAAEKFRKHIDLLHVYGQLGHLPEFLPDREQIGVPYGGDDIFRAAFSMKVIGRPVEPALDERLAKVDFIVFVGFAFLDENLRLLDLDKLSPKTIISTGFGISDGARYSLQQICPQHTWLFGEENDDAAMFFRKTDLFRQLKNPDALRRFVQRRAAKPEVFAPKLEPAQTTIETLATSLLTT